MKDIDGHFAFLFDLLKDNYSNYSNYVFSTTSAIILIIGWLLTSKDARDFISGHPPIKTGCVICIVLFFFAEIYFSSGAVGRSTLIINQIQTWINSNPGSHINDDYYSTKSVVWKGVIALTAAHALLYSILILMINYISKPKSPKHI